MIDSNDLYLFPTDVNKEVKTDFRDAYRWAYYEYHLFIQPMYVALSRGTKEASKRESIQKEELKPYYDFIWENIKLADKVDKPQNFKQKWSLRKSKRNN
nr:hypothetical protein [Mycoplasmopsis bovis]